MLLLVVDSGTDPRTDDMALLVCAYTLVSRRVSNSLLSVLLYAYCIVSSTARRTALP